MDEIELIIGIHSIAACLLNKERQNIKLVYTSEGLDELLKKSDVRKSELSKIETEMVSSHALQEQAKQYFKKLDIEFQRIPSQIFLVTQPLEAKDVNWLYDQVIMKDELKILCLDQITDVHNGGAILRTASFYGVDIVILPSRKSFGLTPSFYRIASGATEYLQMVNVSSLPKMISKFNEYGVTIIGLTEHAEKPIDENLITTSKKLCLVLGKEETGISNAVLRLIENKMSLSPKGEIRSLNVSVAAAIAMEKSFGKK
jgi:23S rRNA (guanosine2251-2'-O)-methyltransferase